MSALVGDEQPGDGRTVTRRSLLWGAAAAGFGLALPGRVRATLFHRELLSAVSIHNGAKPYAGDGPLLTTVSAGGANGRTEAVVRFVLGRPAMVQLAVLDENANVTDHAGTTNPALTVETVEQSLPAGAHGLSWAPSVSQAPTTYALVLTVTDSGGRIARHRTVARVLGLDAAFTQRSYAPGEAGTLVVASDVESFTAQVFRAGTESVPTYANNVMNGVPAGDPGDVLWTGNADAPAPIPVSVGAWPSGLYFVQLTAGDLVGYAPFVVRPTTPTQKIAVVVPTNTWGAYNFYDRNGDGYGDSWYVGWKLFTVDLTRPNIHRGVPYRFRSYDLAFLHWLAQTGKNVDYYADDDLGSFPDGDALRAAYDLVVFPGHSEYVTWHAYDVVERYRDLGGNLMFLSANNFFRRVDPHSSTLHLIGLWRALGKPEAALLGTQYCGSDRGQHQAPFVVTADGAGAGSWAFAGTGLGEGASFGKYGIEVDARTVASPPGTIALAQIPNALGKPNLTAEMTYYETPAGARVFSAGALNFGGQVTLWPETTTLLENVWARLAPTA